MAMAAWRAKQPDFDPEQLLFLDETGTSLSMVPQYGWAPTGQRARGSVPTGHRRHHTLIGTLSASGMGPSLLVEGSIDRVAFDTFLEELVIPDLRPGQTVIMDNASIHHGTRTRQLLEAAGAHLCFLPTSAPEFNPIEGAFAKLKQGLRQRQARTPETLLAAVKAGLESITTTDAAGFFRGAGYPLGQLPCKTL